ncbi:MAG: acyltransferase family protein [Deltaproteobacteria bacterium]|nr:acyltransferase family protein [Candidatus Zymogenaceae bacterium]
MRSNDAPNRTAAGTASVSTPAKPKISGRRHDVDWLRVLAMGTIFLFHCARPFDHDDWHVKNLVLSHGMDIFIVFTVQWIMPLFFILSGIGAFYALNHRTKGTYIRERFFRLVVPLVFGIFALAPPQVYIERISHNQFEGGFLSFLPHYFDGMYGFGGNFAWMGLHLWYIEMLFVFSLATLPLFCAVLCRKLKFFRNAASPGATLGGILLPVVPLFLMELFVNTFPDSIGIRSFGGWSPLTYLVFFITGFFIVSDGGFSRAFERYRTVWLIMGISTSVIGLVLIETGVLNGLPRSATLPIEAMLRALNSWFWLMAIIGFGRRYLSFSNRALTYLNRAVLPFYILHQTVIVIIAFFLVGWDAPVPVKYAALVALSFVVIMALYEGIVRRIGVLRFLFGMKKA